MLEGLTEAQRTEIHPTVLVAHTNPQLHPIYHEPWLRSASNKILEYDIGNAEFARLRLLEEEHHFRNKSMYDYGYLLQDCYATGAQWIAMLEDDVLAMEGWYDRAKAALRTIQSEVGQLDWLYLRMFYTENLLGWNGEEWVRYLATSCLCFVATASILVGGRAYSGILQRNVSNLMVAMICFVCLPACIVLYFMAGRVSMQPLSPGVHKMPNFGCCSQGFIFPREIVPRVIDRAHQAIDEDYYIDMMLERWADTESLTRFVLIPSLLQHIGSKSSKGWGFDEGAVSTWNFGFEKHVEHV